MNQSTDTGVMGRGVTFGLYVVGVVFLVLTGWTWYNSTRVLDVAAGQFVVVDEAFDYEGLRGPGGFEVYGAPGTSQPGQLVAIFTMPGDECGDSLNDLDAYLEVLERDGLEGNPVHVEIVIVGEDAGVVKRFARVAGFEDDVLYGAGPSHAQQIQSFGEKIARHQFMLLDPDAGHIFFRARLAAGPRSPEEVRTRVMWEAGKAYEVFLNESIN